MTKDLPPPRDPVESIGMAYEKLLEKAVEESHRLGDKTGPKLHQLIDAMREKVAVLEELTEEEMEKLADYLKRDLRDAAQYLTETGEDFRNWVGFDVELIEDRLRDLFKRAADQTTVELLALKEQAMDADYHTTEITGPGTLVCDACGEKVQFRQPARIPPCPKCQGTTFHRQRDTP